MAKISQDFMKISQIYTSKFFFQNSPNFSVKKITKFMGKQSLNFDCIKP